MSHFTGYLYRSTRLLPADLRLWMSRAMDSGWFEIGPGDYEGGPGGTVCPVTAAAKLAGAWRDGGIARGWEHWGTDEGPAEVVEDFASYFDLVAEDHGIDFALTVIRSALVEQVQAAVA